ncbi:hypothetical protein [Salinispora sp. H7-4]|uniref:hypothetical protein n=1 Tax=Salinispora sp. H7-4 TaxID=2748321 RepID=UPI0015D37610|nr:hypothetical protein [Salinispora sp. H7-4]NYT96808.1 hypothetical protein [Salinispora sp. H7-4]
MPAPTDPAPTSPFPPPPATSGGSTGPPGRANAPAPGPFPAPRTATSPVSGVHPESPPPTASAASTQAFPATGHRHPTAAPAAATQAFPAAAPAAATQAFPAAGHQQRPGTGRRNPHEGDLSSLYGDGSGLSTVVFPVNPVENSGSLTGHILAQGRTEISNEQRSSNTRVLVALAASLALLVTIGVVVVLIANNALDGAFQNLSSG